MKNPWVLSYPLSTQRRLIRLGGCPGWSESSLGAQPLGWFCHVVVQMRSIIESQKLPLNYRMKYYSDHEFISKRHQIPLCVPFLSEKDKNNFIIKAFQSSIKQTYRLTRDGNLSCILPISLVQLKTHIFFFFIFIPLYFILKVTIWHRSYESEHDKTYSISRAPSKHSAQPRQPHCLISLRCKHEEALGPWLPKECKGKTNQTDVAAQTNLSLCGLLMWLVGFVVLQFI